MRIRVLVEPGMLWSCGNVDSPSYFGSFCCCCCCWNVLEKKKAKRAIGRTTSVPNSTNGSTSGWRPIWPAPICASSPNWRNKIEPKKNQIFDKRKKNKHTHTHTHIRSVERRVHPRSWTTEDRRIGLSCYSAKTNRSPINCPDSSVFSFFFLSHPPRNQERKFHRWIW